VEVSSTIFLTKAMNTDSNESIISELQLLAKKQPLRNNGELNRAKELMITLRKKGYTNNDISKLSSGAWSENTVKLYTRGTDIVDSTSKDEAVKIISEMVKSGLTLNEVSEAVSLKDYLDAENMSLEDIVSLLQDLKSSGLSLNDIIQLNRSIKVEGLSLKQLIGLFMYKSDLEKAGVTVEVLKQFHQASISFGDANLVIKAINEYGNLVALENEINHASAEKEQIQLDTEQLQASLRDIQEKTAKQQELFKEYKELKELGFDEISFKQIKQIAISYGAANNDHNSNISFNSDDDSNSNNNNNNKSVSSIPTKDFVNKAFQALNKFADLSDIESEIKNLQRKRTDLEAVLNKLNSDYAHLQSLIAMCNTLLYDLKFSLPAIEQLYNVAKRYGKPIDVLEAIGKYSNLKSIEKQIEELENKKIELEANMKVLENHIHELKGQADAIKSSMDGLLKPLQQEIAQSFKNSIQAITTTYQQQLSLLKNSSEEYAKRLGAAVILEEELRLARIIMAIFKYPAEVAKNISIDYVILMLDAAIKICRVKGINPKIKVGEASIVAENSLISGIDVEMIRLIEGARRAIERLLGNAAAAV
jgi:predicted  nucleic acid-binding Zn-ribbon protein